MQLGLRGWFLTFICACVTSTSSGSLFSASQPPQISTSFFMTLVLLLMLLGVPGSELITCLKIVSAELARAGVRAQTVCQSNFFARPSEESWISHFSGRRRLRAATSCSTSMVR